MQNIDLLRKKLETIDVEHRSLPFWAWNDALEEKELIRQIQAFSRVGMGGFFIHSREGLETEYLGSSWMALVKKCITESRKLGIEPWIYDEDKWPSGSAGGKVSSINPLSFTAKVVTLERQHLIDSVDYKHIKQDGQVISLYLFDIKTNDFSEIKDDLTMFPITILIARAEISGPSSWYNDHAPTDMMDPQAIRQFISLTHETYEQALGQEVFEQIQGFFTDEPNVYDFFLMLPEKRSYLPWSTNYLYEFEQRRGYSIIADLPYLFLDGEQGRSVRFDYWKTVSELFLENYTKQVHQWCSSHRMLLTGHMLYENDLGYQVRTSGAVMPHYRYMDMPAIDLLADQCSEYLTVKQCSSVANQFGKKHVLSETYGCTGWDLTFQTQLRLGNWQYVMGITRRCQHLALYSIAGCRKRDYPPSFNYQTSWFENLSLLEEYFARLSVCTTMGEVQREILVIHPISSFWIDGNAHLDEDLSQIEMNMGWTDPSLLSANKKGNRYNSLAKTLLSHGYDFDFGDEQIIEKEAIVTGNQVQVGIKRYRIILIPPVDNLFSSTIKILSSFVKNRGILLWMGSAPSYVDGKRSEKARILFEHHSVLHAVHTKEALRLLESQKARAFFMQTDEGISVDNCLGMCRKFESCMLFIIHNLKREPVENIYLATRISGRLFNYNLWENTTHSEKQMEFEPGLYVSRCSFKADEVKVFILDLSQKAELFTLEPLYRHPHQTLKIIAAFPQSNPISLSTDNAMILDTCSYKIENGDFSFEQPVWMAQRAVRRELRLPDNHKNGEKQRFVWLSENTTFKSYDVTFRFAFTVNEPLEHALSIAIEKPVDYTVLLDGKKLYPQEHMFLDRTLLSFPVEYVSARRHILDINLPYSEKTEFEDIYLHGKFSVSIERTLSKPISYLNIGNWCTQGLLHFPGNVTYHYTFDPVDKQNAEVFLLIKQFSGTLALICINGEAPISVFSNNSPIAVGHLLFEDQNNEVTIEIVGSLRNLLGPFHRIAESCSRISWEDFRTEGPLYSEYYQTKSMGLLDEVIFYTL